MQFYEAYSNLEIRPSATTQMGHPDLAAQFYGLIQFGRCPCKLSINSVQSKVEFFFLRYYSDKDYKEGKYLKKGDNPLSLD